MMTRPRTQFSKAQLTQFAAQRLARDADPEFLPHPLRETGETPTYHTINRRIGAGPDHSGQGRARHRVQQGFVATRLAVDSPAGPWVRVPVDREHRFRLIVNAQSSRS